MILQALDPAQAPDEAGLPLTAAERAAIGRRRQPADRARGLLARALLRRELGRRLGLDPLAVPIVEGPGGKPGLGPGCAGLHFSVAHSGGLIALAFAAVPVGIDVEQRRAMEVGAFARRAFAPAEAERIARDGRPLHALFDHWVAREAVVKATGQGIGAGFPGLVLHRPGPELQPLAAGPAAVRVALIAVPEGYHGAVAVMAGASP